MRALAGRLWCAALLLVLAEAHAAVGSRSVPPDLQPVGSGRLTWFGMTVYRATLYAVDGGYRPDRPHAIRIDYALSFSREQLARRSLEEMERFLGGLPGRGEVLQRLRAALRDVSEGDHIVGVHYPGQRAEFFSNGESLGRIDDPELAAAFFAIWLNPQTREPGLRAELLGRNP